MLSFQLLSAAHEAPFVLVAGVSAVAVQIAVAVAAVQEAAVSMK